MRATRRLRSALVLGVMSAGAPAEPVIGSRRRFAATGRSTHEPRPPAKRPAAGGTACPLSRGSDAVRTLIPLLILGVIASEALAGPGVLTDQEMDAITAANSGQEQQWVVAGDRPMVDTFHTRATAQHEIRTPANVAVDTAGVRDAATAVARGSEAAVSALRAAGVRVPADLNSGTARSSQSVTAVSRSNERVVKATASASASGTDRLITRTVTRVSLKN